LSHQQSLQDSYLVIITVNLVIIYFTCYVCMLGEQAIDHGPPFLSIVCC